MKRIFGVAAIVAGAVLAVFFWDLEFAWFDGGPLGIVLMVLGGIELLETARGRKPKGFVEELRDDLGIKDSGDRGPGPQRDKPND